MDDEEHELGKDSTPNLNRLALFLGAIVFVWFLPSVFLFATGQNSGFQRMGSILVALAVLGIAMNRRTINWIFDGIVESWPEELDSPEFVAPELEKEILKHPELFRAIRPEITDEEIEGIVFVLKLRRSFSKAGGFKKTMLQMRYRLRNLEVWLVFFGTLQWGFGDLVVSAFVNGGAD